VLFHWPTVTSQILRKVTQLTPARLTASTSEAKL
jgi:hypothetical protein